MSEKFGLDWKDRDFRRMSEFICIMEYIGEKQERELKKQYGRS